MQAPLLRPTLLSPLLLLLSLDAAAGSSASQVVAGSITIGSSSSVLNNPGASIGIQGSISTTPIARVAGPNISLQGGGAQVNRSVIFFHPGPLLIPDGSQLPTGGSVSSGSASFNAQGNVLTVTNSAGAVINWQDFSIGPGATTNFVQPSASSVVLNRVVGQNASTIAGTLSSNGRVFLMNPNGALFTSGAQINTAGFKATTNTISNAEFLAGSNGSGSGFTFSVEGPLSVQGGTLSITNSSIDVTASLITQGNLTFTAPQIQTVGTPLIPSDPFTGTGVLPVLISPAVQPLVRGTSGGDFQAVAVTGSSASVASAPARVAAATFTLQKREPMF